MKFTGDRIVYLSLLLISKRSDHPWVFDDEKKIIYIYIWFVKWMVNWRFNKKLREGDGDIIFRYNNLIK